MKIYNDKFKERIIKEFQTTSAGKLAKKYQINKYTIETWIERSKKTYNLIPKKIQKLNNSCLNKECQILRKFVSFLNVKKK